MVCFTLFRGVRAAGMGHGLNAFLLVFLSLSATSGIIHVKWDWDGNFYFMQLFRFQGLELVAPLVGIR